jgi:hypothetical protein
MGAMKQLSTHAEELAGDDRISTLTKWIINQHLAGKYTIDELPAEVQFTMYVWEQEMMMERGIDEQAKVWEEGRKSDIHRAIQFAVKNGQLDYDQGMELINNPEQAEAWMEKGVL